MAFAVDDALHTRLTLEEVRLAKEAEDRAKGRGTIPADKRYETLADLEEARVH